MTDVVTPEAPGAREADAVHEHANATAPRDGITFEAIAVIALAIAMVAVFLAVIAMSLATRAIDEHRAIPAGGNASAPVTVSLTEFSISPPAVTLAAGGTLTVTNAGSVPHDLAVEGIATPLLSPGDAATLDASSLTAGEYTMYCQIPGHREAGMEAQLTVE